MTSFAHEVLVTRDGHLWWSATGVKKAFGGNYLLRPAATALV